jgi:hypothetical protein
MKRGNNIPLADSVRKQLESLASKMGSGTLSVGFLEGEVYPDGTPVAQVAYWNEFGTSTAPARSFFRTMVTAQSGTWGATMSVLAMQNELDGKKTLNQMGKIIAGELQESIVNTNAPALSEVTLLLRSRFWTNPQDITGADVGRAKRDVAAGKTGDVTDTQSKPLVWQGIMLQAVSWEVKGAHSNSAEAIV